MIGQSINGQPVSFAEAARLRYQASQQATKPDPSVRFGKVKALFQSLRERFTKKDHVIDGTPQEGILERIKGFFSGKGKWILIAIGIVIVLIGGYLILSKLDQGVIPARPSNPTVVETPPSFTFHPVDSKSVSFIGSTLILMFIALFALFPLGILDGKERLQVSDVTVAIAGFFLNYIVVWKPFVAFWTTLIPIFNEQSTAILFGIVITAVVVTKAITGGRDTTNLGVYFGCLAIAGAIWQHMGAFQAAFGVPSQPVYLLQDLPPAILSQQFSEVRYSLLVYSVLFLAVASYLIDIVYPKGKKVRWEGVAASAILVGVFYLARIKFEVEYALVLGIAAGVILAVITRKTGGKLVLGENALAQVVQRVFDYTAWDGVGLGVVLVVFLRLMSLA